MRLIDQEDTRAPLDGSRKMTTRLHHHHGYQVNHKRIARLMAKRGLRAVSPRPRPSVPHKAHQKYPYLLRDLAITRPNQVWCADITDVPLRSGFMDLVAMMDGVSRFVLAWQLSNPLDGAFCLAAWRLTLRQAPPEIFNTDQGVPFTAHDFTGELEATGIRIRMDGRGRVFDNIFIERLWRSVKYEDIYIKAYDTVPALATGLDDYFQLDNDEWPSQRLSSLVPADVHFAVKGPIRGPDDPPSFCRSVVLTMGVTLFTGSQRRKQLCFVTSIATLFPVGNDAAAH